MFLWILTFYQTGPDGLFIFYQVFNLILQSAKNIRSIFENKTKEVKISMILASSLFIFNFLINDSP